VTTLLLVRHGETNWNAERRWQGHADVPLNDRGRKQARTLAEQLAGERIDVIYTSDLSRARDTADAVGARLGVEVVVDPDLREIDAGAIEGLTAEEARPTPSACFGRSTASPSGTPTAACSSSRTAARCAASTSTSVSTAAVRSRTASCGPARTRGARCGR